MSLLSITNPAPSERRLIGGILFLLAGLPVPDFPNPSTDDGENDVKRIDQLGNGDSRRNKQTA